MWLADRRGVRLADRWVWRRVTQPWGLHNGWGRGGEGLSGWWWWWWWGGTGCFLWITSYIYEALQQRHANERLDKTAEQESSASPLLRHHFCKPIPFSLHFTAMTEDLYQDSVKPFTPMRWNFILNEHSLIKSVQTAQDSVGYGFKGFTVEGAGRPSLCPFSFFSFSATCIVPISAARLNVWAATASVDDHGHKT